MSGWVCSARKFVVSSLVSFAEELEQVVLVLTDGEPAQEYGPNVQATALVVSSDTAGTTVSMMDVTANMTKTHEANVYVLSSNPASSHMAALTTQPAPSASLLSSASSMTSLPLSSLHNACPLSASQSLPNITKGSLTTAKVSTISSSRLKSSTASRLSSQTSRNTHNPYIHRSRNSRHSPTIQTDFDSNEESRLSPSQLTVHSCPQGGSTTTVIVASKRPKEMSLFNLKRPGKVVRTSSSDNTNMSQPSAISGHVFQDCEEWSQVEADEFQPTPTLSSQSLPSPRTPEDLSIPNRSIQPAYEEHKVSRIQRVSLVGKLSQMLHSTLITISNLLQLENEDRTTIYRNARRIQGLPNEPDNEKRQNTGDLRGYQNSLSNESSDMEVKGDGNLKLSRINSMVSLESFEILSKEEDDIKSFQPVVEFRNTFDLPSNSESKASLFEELNQSETISKEEECTDMEMSSSIQFINFEVSDLITKRYFDSKTQRLEALSTNGTLQQANPSNEEEAMHIGGHTQESDSKEFICAPNTAEDDDTSSASFDVISEDLCTEHFDIL